MDNIKAKLSAAVDEVMDDYLVQRSGIETNRILALDRVEDLESILMDMLASKITNPEEKSDLNNTLQLIKGISWKLGKMGFGL